MAELKVLKVTKDKVQGDRFRAALDGGCNLPNCTCSAAPYIAISDGKTWMKITLTASDVRRLRTGGHVDLIPERNN